MVTSRRFAVHYQNYVTLSTDGGPPITEMRPQWVELPANAPDEPGMVVLPGPQPGVMVQPIAPVVPVVPVQSVQSVQHVVPVQPVVPVQHVQPVFYVPPMVVTGSVAAPGPITYQRPNPNGQMATFTIPWHNPQVGARHWDPTKPMPVADWYARNFR